MPGDGAGYRGGFNELRPGADDGGDFHLMMEVSPFAGRCAVSFPTSYTKAVSTPLHTRALFFWGTLLNFFTFHFLT